MPKTIKTILKLTLTLAIFYFLFRKFNVKVSEIFQNVQWFPFIIVAVLIRLLLMPLITINRWKMFLKVSGIEEKFFPLLKISFTSSFLGVILPSSQGSDVMRMYHIEKRHKNIANAFTPSSTVIIERMIGFILLAITGLICSILIPYFDQKEKVVTIIAVINLLILAVVIFLTNKNVYMLISNLLSRIKIFKKGISFIEKSHHSIVTFPYQKILFPSVFLILLLQLCTITIAYFVFLSFGIQLPFYQHISFYPIIVILSVIPISISGLGLRESLFIYFYSMVGVAPEIAIGVSLVNYTIETLLAVGIGGVIVFFDTIRSKKNTIKNIDWGSTKI